MNGFHSRAILLVGLVILALLPWRQAPARAAAHTQPQSLRATQGQGPEDPQELAAFLDDFFARQMATSHIPGAAIVLVKDGREFVSRGYGWADVEKQIPVDPQRTLFRAGSVAKLFTATAVMQLVERGQLDLDQDVNAYLETFQVPGPASVPVTTAHLLTHTAGFDERLSGMATFSPRRLVPLGRYLAANLPARVMPPGDQVSYSNHGYALAGYLVEAVSGVPFADYIQANLLAPLEMTRSTFQEPPPSGLAMDLAVGYAYRKEGFQSLPVEYFHTVPAASLTTNASDMAHFLIAHLQDGRYGGTRILDARTARRMHHHQFSHLPGLPGRTYGFFEWVENGQRGLAQDGGVTGFSSLVYLLPDHNLGLFVVLNASSNPLAGVQDARQALVSQFLDRYFPSPERPRPAPSPGMDLARFRGRYRINRYARTTLEKGLPPTPLLQYRVHPDTASSLTLTPPAGLGEASRWVPVGPLLFQRLDGDGYLAFRTDTDGRVTHLFMDLLGPQALEKVRWFESDRFQPGLLGFMLVAFLSVLAWPAAGLLRRMARRPGAVTGPPAKVRLLAYLVAGLNLLFLLVVGVRMGQVFTAVFSPTPGYFLVALLLPIATTVLTMGLVVVTVQAWLSRAWSLASRLHFALLSLASLAFIWFADYWNLLGYRL